MRLPLALAAVDAAAAVYLLVWALRRERRDKPLVALVGVVLLVCAAVLLVAAQPGEESAPHLPPAVPPGHLV